jgi:hypothetical protein
MDAITVTLCPFLHEEIEPVTVCVVKKDILPGVSSQYHVVKGAWIMDSGFSSHGGSLSGLSNYTSLTPLPCPVCRDEVVVALAKHNINFCLIQPG